MGGVLVDTSVWVGHFRAADPLLLALLVQDRVVMHPLVLAEIACGTPPARTRTLADLGSLRAARQATLPEVMEFVEREQLYGLGCGIVDLTLLASTLITPGTRLWSLDKRLAGLAKRFDVLHRPSKP